MLFKSAITRDPVFRLVWTQAYEELSNASHVYFIGYSFPTTDIAARTLFDESLSKEKKPAITVVNYADKGNTQQQDDVKVAYRAVFDNLPDQQFFFDGALRWVRPVSRNYPRSQDDELNRTILRRVAIRHLPPLPSTTMDHTTSYIKMSSA